MDHPDHIDKRKYSCNSCNYSSQVYGESYFDSGCYNFMATFECPECKVLFEGLISQINMDEDTFDMNRGLADEIECLRCGNKKAKVWNKAIGKCPKCNSEMSYNVIGSIQVKF
jgi:hypothetical protein